MNVVEFKSLWTLESQYDKVYPWFDKNFEKKIKDLVQVVDKEHPLVLPDVGGNEGQAAVNTSKTSNSFEQQRSTNKEDLKNKFKSFKNSF